MLSLAPLLVSLASAQDAAADLARARAALGNSKALTLDYVVIRTLSNGTQTRSEALVRRDGPRYYARQESSELLISAEGAVVVDRAARTLELQRGVSLPPAADPLGRTLAEAAAGLSWLGERDGLRCYRFEAESTLPGGELCLDPANGLPASLVLAPTPLPDGTKPAATRVEVRYTRRSLEPDRSQDWYDLDRILSADRSSPAPAYRGYRVLGATP